MLFIRSLLVISFFFLALIGIGNLKEAKENGIVETVIVFISLVVFNWLAVIIIIGSYNLDKTVDIRKFTLEQYLKDTTQEVITRNGKPVKIIYTDMKNTDFPIVAIINIDGTDNIFRYTVSGKTNINFNFKGNCYNLCFRARKQSGWIYLYKCLDNNGNSMEVTSILFKNKKDAEKEMKRDNGFGLTEITWEE